MSRLVSSPLRERHQNDVDIRLVQRLGTAA